MFDSTPSLRIDSAELMSFTPSPNIHAPDTRVFFPWPGKGCVALKKEDDLTDCGRASSTGTIHALILLRETIHP
jgi:hypothetical protein